MHEVESISHTGVRLLDAAEVSLMAESQPILPVPFHLEISTRHVDAYQGTIVNTLYVRVTLFLDVLR